MRLNPLRDRFELLIKLCHDTIGAVHIGEKRSIKSKSISSSEKKAPKNKKYVQCLICYESAEEIYHEECMLSVFGSKINPIVDIDEVLLEKLAKNQLNQKHTIAGVQKNCLLTLWRITENFFA